MKGIFQTYGQILAYVILTGGLVMLAVLTAKGVGRISATGAAQEENKMQAAIERYYQGNAPVITYTGGTLWMGVYDDPERYFQAVDEENRQLEVCVRGIWDEQGQEIEYPFVRSGRYRMEVGAQDDKGRSTVASFWVPVNQGGI